MEPSPSALRAWADGLRSEELEAIFTPAMIREHFRVLDLGTVLPGQNCEIPPPYVITLNFLQPAATGRIDFFTRTITLVVPPGNGLKRLTPSFTVVRPGTRVWVGREEQVSGQTFQDFSRPVVYRLVAPDGASADWTVIVKSGP